MNLTTNGAKALSDLLAVLPETDRQTLINQLSLKPKTLAEKAERFVKRMMRDKSILVHYLRNKKGRPIGVVVGIPDGFARVSVGFAKNDRREPYNKYVGIYVAIGRALKRDRKDSPGYEMMRDRAERYFLKNRNVA